MVQISSRVGRDSYEAITRGGRSHVVRNVIRPQPRQAMHAVRTLSRSLAGLELPDEVRSEAGRALDEIEDELRIPDPDRGVVTARLERFTELLTESGAVAQAGGSLIRPIRTIAAWLGPIGAALVGQLA